jgi:hypothetical protein
MGSSQSEASISRDSARSRSRGKVSYRIRANHNLRSIRFQTTKVLKVRIQPIRGLIKSGLVLSQTHKIGIKPINVFACWDSAKPEVYASWDQPCSITLGIQPISGLSHTLGIQVSDVSKVMIQPIRGLRKLGLTNEPPVYTLQPQLLCLWHAMTIFLRHKSSLMQQQSFLYKQEDG